MTMTPEKAEFLRAGIPDRTNAALVQDRPKGADKTIELDEPALTQEIEPGPSRRRNRGRTREEQPLASEILDEVLVPVTIRLKHRTAQALKRAALQQRLKHARPDTLQDIGEEAIVDLLTKMRYLD